MGWVSRLRVALLAVFLLSPIPVPVSAQLESKRSLYGLDEVKVVVANIHPDAERRGVSRAGLQSDIEQRLQQIGIRILTEDKWQEIPGQPLLYLSIGVEPLDSFPVYSATIRLQLRQNSCLARNLIICETAITWEEVSAIRTVSVSRLASLQEDIDEVVDRFINAYQKENSQP